MEIKKTGIMARQRMTQKMHYPKDALNYLGSCEKTVDYWVRKINQMGFHVELKESSIA